MDDNKKDIYTTEIDRGATFINREDGSTDAVATASGYKLHSTNWLGDMPDVQASDIFEVRFKNTRRSFYHNVNKLPLQKGDIVAVESSPGHDIGIISLTGDLVARQMRRVGFNPQNGEYKKIYRKAKPYDIEKWQEAIALEHNTMIRSRQYAAQLGLNMKIGDVEYQGDKIKAIFYYIADERVDFRELIKVFAEQFKIRIEMKQIGARQEAGRIGGLGSCGREQCCSGWISNFVSVTTNTARTQDISLNPQKLAGQCGKLKCCLTYEFDSYMDARKELPRVNQPLQLLDGNYFLVKTDILSNTMWFSTDPHSLAGMKPIPAKRVKELMQLNSQGIKPDSLESEDVVSKRDEKQEPSFINAMGEDSITRFDRSRGERRSGSRGGRNSRNRNRSEQSEQQGGESRTEQKGESRGEQSQSRRSNSKQDGGRRNDRRAQSSEAQVSTDNSEVRNSEKPEGRNSERPQRRRNDRGDRANRAESAAKSDVVKGDAAEPTEAGANNKTPRGEGKPRNERSRGRGRRYGGRSGDQSRPKDDGSKADAPKGDAPKGGDN